MLSRLVAASLPLVPRRVVARIGRRYVAGVGLDDAIATVRALTDQGLRTTTDLLGEKLRDPRAVEATVAEYVRVLEALNRHGLEGGISVKPTHVGLSIDTAHCRDSLDRLATEAARHGRFVRIDMEDHGATDATLAMHEELRRRHHGVGVVLQAYLRRTLDDVEALPDGSSVRLCKGIYAEPAYVTVGGYEEVRANYLLVLDRLLELGHRPAIATHDEWLIGEALRRMEARGQGRGRAEIQMLLGVAPILRQRLLAEGHRVRVYVPYGPDWYDYSVRRLRENPRIAMHVVRALFGRS